MEGKRYFIFVPLILLGLIIAGLYFFYRTQESHHRRAVEAQLKSIVNLKIDQILHFRDEEINHARVFVENPFTKRVLLEMVGNPEKETVRQVLNLFLALNGDLHYADIVLVDERGKVRFSLYGRSFTLPSEMMRTLKNAFYYKQPLLTDLYREAHFMEPHFDIVAPFFADGKGGKPVGAVIFTFAANNFLFPLIKTWPIPSETAETLLVRREKDHVLFLNEVRHQKNTALRLTIPLTREEVPAVMAALGKEGFVEGKDYRGVEVLAYLSKIPGMPWFIVAKVDKKEVLASQRILSLMMISLIVSLLFLLIAVSLALHQREKKRHYRALYREVEARRVSEERYRVTLLNIGDGVISTDATGNVEFINPVAEELTGWMQEEAIGRPLEEVFHIINEETRFPVENPIKRVLREGVVVGLANHTVLVARNGTEYPIADSGAPIRDEKGEITGVVLVFRDQTKERETTKTLRESERMLKLVLDTIPVMVYWEDGQGKLMGCNRAFAFRLGGKRPEELRGRDLSSLGWEEVKRVSLMEGGSAFGSEEILYVTPTGQQFWVKETRVPLEDEKGEIFGYLGVLDDITRRKESEEDVRVMAEMLDVAPNAITVVDFDGRILYGNAKAAEMHKYERWELMGMRVHELIAPRDATMVDKRISAAAEKGEVAFEAIHLCKDGTEIPFEVFVKKAYWKDKPVMLTIGTDISARKRQEEQLHLLASAIAHAGEIIIITNPEGEIQYVNPAFESTTGYRREEALGRKPNFLKSGEHDEDFYRQLWTTITSGQRWHGHFINKKKDGTLYEEEATITPVFDEKGDIVNFVAVKRDITHEREMERQFRQAQKMEAVGRLAGGIAHDFNNMLQAVFGRTEIAMARIGPDHPVKKDLEEILKVGKRSSNLVRQLLAFARKQTIKPKILDLTDTISGMLKMLRRLVGENIELIFMPGANVGKVKIDPSQIDQILANLVVNARDAIENVGKITIETENADLDRDYCEKHVGFIPGSYVVLSVSDDGCGMDKDMLNMIFEPFFTTKGPEEGSGLGLATVYGIVKQNNGFINVYSELGKGTTFKIYLPRVEGTPEEVPEEKREEALPVGTETILLVEDDEAIMNLGKAMLEFLGYKVLVANNPLQAIDLVKNYGGRIHLLITDVIMPEMNGKELAEELKSINPGLRCLFMSGYTTNVIAHHGVLEEGIHFLQKPFSIKELAEKVRETLRG